MENSRMNGQVHVCISYPVKSTLTVLAVILLAISGGYYYFWKQERVEAWEQSKNPDTYKSVRDQFLAHVRSGELPQAYGLTSKRFQDAIDRFQFAMLAQRYNKLDQQTQNQYIGEAVGQSGPGTTNPSGLEHQYAEFHREFQYADGKSIMITLGLRRDPDSMFLWTPPGFKIDVFSIDEKPGKAR